MSRGEAHLVSLLPHHSLHNNGLRRIETSCADAADPGICLHYLQTAGADCSWLSSYLVVQVITAVEDHTVDTKSFAQVFSSFCFPSACWSCRCPSELKV